jgi:hypothetical protein
MTSGNRVYIIFVRRTKIIAILRRFVSNSTPIRVFLGHVWVFVQPSVDSIFAAGCNKGHEIAASWKCTQTKCVRADTRHFTRRGGVQFCQIHNIFPTYIILFNESLLVYLILTRLYKCLDCQVQRIQWFVNIFHSTLLQLHWSKLLSENCLSRTIIVLCSETNLKRRRQRPSEH